MYFLIAIYSKNLISDTILTSFILSLACFEFYINQLKHTRQNKQSAYLFNFSQIYRSTYLLMYLYIIMCTCPSIHLYIIILYAPDYLLTYLYSYLSIHLYQSYLPIYISIHYHLICFGELSSEEGCMFFFLFPLSKREV